MAQPHFGKYKKPNYAAREAAYNRQQEIAAMRRASRTSGRSHREYLTDLSEDPYSKALVRRLNRESQLRREQKEKMYGKVLGLSQQTYQLKKNIEGVLGDLNDWMIYEKGRMVGRSKSGNPSEAYGHSSNIAKRKAAAIAKKKAIAAARKTAEVRAKKKAAAKYASKEAIAARKAAALKKLKWTKQKRIFDSIFE